MILLLLILSFSNFVFPEGEIAGKCQESSTDYVMFVKAPYYLTENQWSGVKQLASKIAASVEIGRNEEDSRLGVTLFDNTNTVKTAIELDMFGRPSDLLTAIQQLSSLPCGSWCSTRNYKSDEEQFATFLNNLHSSTSVSGRTVKVILVSTSSMDVSYLQQLQSMYPKTLLYQFHVPSQAGVLTYDSPNYNYYQAYYEQYKRYSERMRQVYPYQNTQQYVPDAYYQPFGYTAAQDDVVNDACYQITTCQTCYVQASSDKEPETDSKPIHDSSSNSGSSNKTATMQPIPPLPPKDEEYEYEIIGDPPGIEINKTPLADAAVERLDVDHEYP